MDNKVNIEEDLDTIDEVSLIQTNTQVCTTQYDSRLQWLEHLRNHENIFETRVVRANEC